MGLNPGHDRPFGLLVAEAVFGVVLVMGLITPFSPYDPVADVHLSLANRWPDAAHWLGTDHLGRDVAARLLHSARWFVLPGVAACLVAVGFGVPMGAWAGWYRGAFEVAFRAVFTVVGAVPRFVLVLLALAIFGDEPPVLALSAGLAFVPFVGEAVRARIEELATAEYVLASRAHGLSDARVLWVHLVWLGARRAIARQAIGLFGYYLVLETTLSYIGGFGVQQPEPSWGNMIVFGWGEANPFSAGAPIVALWATSAAVYRVAEAWGGGEHA